jgi:hypothetical protein
VSSSSGTIRHATRPFVSNAQWVKSSLACGSARTSVLRLTPEEIERDQLLRFSAKNGPEHLQRGVWLLAYSTTSSVEASNAGRIVRPSALAPFMLMTTWKLLAGRQDGGLLGVLEAVRDLTAALCELHHDLLVQPRVHLR